MGMSESHTVIVGGGIVGVCAAYFLARRGARVTLLEQDTLDDSASTGNAGLISLAHGPIPSPGKIIKALKWMFNATSPLYVKPRLDPALLKWMWGFRAACTPQHWRYCLKVLAEHGWPAGQTIRELVETERLECEYRPLGQLDVFRTEAGFAKGRAEADLIKQWGYECEYLSGDELRAREPAFRDEVVGAVLAKERAFADPGAFVTELADRARKHGAELREQSPVQRLLVTSGRCTGVELNDSECIDTDHVILAAGAWSTPLARAVGVNVPMQAAKGYHINLTAPQPCTSLGCVLMESYVAVTPMAGGLRVAGTLELGGINHRIIQKRVDMLRVGARKFLHGIDETETLSQWCGLRPCTADGLPIIGWAPRVKNLFIATGHAMMGFGLGPLAGRVAAEHVLDGESDVDLAPFTPGRFA